MVFHVSIEIVKKEKKSGNFEVVKNSLNIILEKNIISISKQLTDVIKRVTISLESSI